MTDAETSADPSRFQRFHAGLLKFCKHPASILAWFCLFSLIIKEQYPFSHYPMYSGWSHRTHYFYIADEDGPIKAKQVFKVSVPRTKKLYGGILGDLKDEQKKSYDEMTSADHQEAGRRLLEQLRQNAPANRRKKFGDIMDRDLTLMRVEILREKDQFSSTPKEVVTTGADNQIVAPST